MGKLGRYRKRSAAAVVAVQLDLDTDGFTYRKWGGVQTCKRGDWLVDNQGDRYTVDGETFARTYRPVSPGLYLKVTPVWAERAEAPGVIRTQEGETHYRRGDHLVYNSPDRQDGYAVSPELFAAMYQEVAGEAEE